MMPLGGRGAGASPETRRAIRELRAVGLSVTMVAARLGVSRSTVYLQCPSAQAPRPKHPCPKCGQPIDRGSQQCGPCSHAAVVGTGLSPPRHRSRLGRAQTVLVTAATAPQVVVHVCVGTEARPCGVCGPAAHHWELAPMTCEGRCLHCGTERVHKPPEADPQEGW